MSGTRNNLRLLGALHRAIHALPDWAATAERFGVIVEDEWGQKYDLVGACRFGRDTVDPGLVLKIRRMQPQSPADRPPNEPHP